LVGVCIVAESAARFLSAVSSDFSALPCPVPLRSCKGGIFTYNGAYPDGTGTQGGYSTHYVVNKR